MRIADEYSLAQRQWLVQIGRKREAKLLSNKVELIALAGLVASLEAILVACELRNRDHAGGKPSNQV
jgi:hypothetical protein